MGTIIINGKRFDGNNVTVRDGKIIIDGKPQDDELHGDVELQVVESVAGRAECVASVTSGATRGDAAASATVSCETGAGGAIRAVAVASADSRRHDEKKR
jgi:formylmethanofuran dehydrogenase subunit C